MPFSKQYSGCQQQSQCLETSHFWVWQYAMCHSHGGFKIQGRKPEKFIGRGKTFAETLTFLTSYHPQEHNESKRGKIIQCSLILKKNEESPRRPPKMSWHLQDFYQSYNRELDAEVKGRGGNRNMSRKLLLVAQTSVTFVRQMTGKKDINIFNHTTDMPTTWVHWCP